MTAANLFYFFFSTKSVLLKFFYLTFTKRTNTIFTILIIMTACFNVKFAVIVLTSFVGLFQIRDACQMS